MNLQKDRSHSDRLSFEEVYEEYYDEIISSLKDVYNGETLTLSSDINQLSQSGKIDKETVFGVPSYVGVLADERDYLVAVYPVSEAWKNWNVCILVLILIFLLVFAVLFVLFRSLITRHMVNGVESLNDSLDKIMGGNLEEKADFRDSMEFDSLSDGVNFMVDRMKEMIKEAKDRIDAELAFAAKIQNSFLPHEFPPFPDREDFELYAHVEPAKEVGGDFYDYFLIDEDHLALTIGDVSGNGIPAALFMVMAKDKIRHSALKYRTDVAGAVSQVNKELLREADAGLSVTVWLGVITLSTGHMDYVDAGHEYPVICRAGGSFSIYEDIRSASLPAEENTEYEAGSIELGSGDILYFYTDGITEAVNKDGEMFGTDRMTDALNANKDASVTDLDTAVRRAVAEFAEDAPRSDDMASVTFRYTGNTADLE